MIAYNQTEILNTKRVSVLDELKEAGFIDKAQIQAFEQKNMVLKTQRNILLRLCFAFLGMLLYGAIISFVSLLFMSVIDKNFWLPVFVFSLIGLGITEFMAHSKYYAFGIDDVAILGFQGFFAGAIYILTDNSLASFATLAIIGALCCIRYVNTLSAIVSLIGITGFVCICIIDYGIINKFGLSFVLFALAALIQYANYNIKKRPDANVYQDALWAVEVFAWALLYLSVNYLVVREAASDLMGFSPTYGQDLPLAFVFYALTFVIPIAYIFFALKWHNRTLLWLGFAALGFSIFSIRFYYHVLPPEFALMAGGIVLFVISYFAWRKLRHKETGITYEKDRFTQSESFKMAEALIANSQTRIASHSKSEMPFGGGGFSGGGSGSTY
ncbi:hypothetical protein [Flavobacterium silvaticum]|uniref:Uncharacterized protein n=1 Tax=Flavobacterium silvaticum TaxID=1852020 RepID=A0A972FLZ7_9FLAO|nr:hypothetical protein [Flavobacterium silvaticum]NMH28456.1 hypothetical protein [Flavobacterium silvaticum]